MTWAPKKVGSFDTLFHNKQATGRKMKSSRYHHCYLGEITDSLPFRYPVQLYCSGSYSDFLTHYTVGRNVVQADQEGEGRNH
jgi:hypothetical protein